MLISEQPPWFHRNNGPNHPAYNPTATVHAHAFLEALLGLIRPTRGMAASPLQPAAASGLATLLRDVGDDVAAPALDLGACPLLVGALREYTPVTFSSSYTRTTTRWTTTLRREAAEALHCLSTLQTPQGCGPGRLHLRSWVGGDYPKGFCLIICVLWVAIVWTYVMIRHLGHSL